MVMRKRTAVGNSLLLALLTRPRSIFTRSTPCAWGLPNGGNQPIDSFAAQTVTIPMSATLAQLNLRLYPVSSETDVALHNRSMVQVTRNM